MGTKPLTTQLDEDLVVELEKIARYDGTSVAVAANQAIRNLVEERRATRDLITTGLNLIDRQAKGLSSEDVHDWLLAEPARPFPDS